MTDRSLDQQIRRVEELVEALERRSDPVAKATARELMQTLLALHQAGLSRLLEIVQQSDSGAAIMAAVGQDRIVSSLLLLHDLHPIDLAARVERVLEQVGPMLRGHGGDLTVSAIAGRRVRLRLNGDCTLSSEALEHLLEEAFLSIAPDMEVIEVENPAGRIRTRMALPIVAETVSP